MKTTICKELHDKVTEIFDSGTPQVYTIDCILYSPDIIDYRIEIDNIDNFDLVQDFIQGYMDFLELEFDLKPSEYMWVTTHYKDLRCTLNLTPVDKDSEEQVGDIITIDQKFVLKNKSDILKQVNKNELLIDDTLDGEHETQHAAKIPVEAQLIDDFMYQFRKNKIAGLVKNKSMEDAIMLCASMFGIKKAYMITPDNTKKYSNLIIPPLIKIDEFLSHLHDRYGIYYKGFNFYITQEVLYVYPAYETKPDDSPYVVNIYKVPTGSYLGSQWYHIVKSKDYHIVCNTKAEEIHRTEHNIENEANAHIVQNCERVIDSWRIMGERKFEVPEDNLTLLDFSNDKGMSEGTLNTKFRQSRNNKFKYVSELANNNYNTLTLGWRNSVPFSIKPGYQILYHYEGEHGYEVRSCVPTSVTYSIRRIENRRVPMYTCTSQINTIIENT